MTAAEQGSGRCSDRVEPRCDDRAQNVTPGAISAPETMLSAGAPVTGLPERSGRRVGTGRLRAIERGLSNRDQAILRDLNNFKFLTTGHLQTLHFSNHNTPTAAARICRRVLFRLAELRVIEHLDRRIGGIRAGSASFVWRVGLIGDRLLRQSSDESPRARRKEPSLHHLDHCLAIADCYVTLISATRDGHIELITVSAEPASWRSYFGAGGQREVIKPDLFAVTATGDYEDHWFIEVDRSTESLPTIVRKCQQYERYRRSGQEQHDSGVFPRVLWLVPDEGRRTKLLSALQTTRRLDLDLFRATTLPHLVTVITGASA